MPEDLRLEPDRAELREPEPYRFDLDRREFLGAGLLLAVLAPSAAEGQQGGLEARLHLGEDGIVTVLSGKVEEGQGARAEIAMAAAEELGLPLAQVRVVLGDTERGGGLGGPTGPARQGADPPRRAPPGPPRFPPSARPPRRRAGFSPPRA